MTRFDDVPAAGGSTLRQAGAAIASQPAIFVLLVMVCCAALLLAIACLAISQEARTQLGLAIGRTQASAFLAPRLPRADAEALRSRIESMPSVSSATLRTRDEAMAALVRDGLPALRDQANPLPDVWIVTLRSPAPEALEKPLSDYIGPLRDTLSSLPGVDSVVVDERWIALVDRWSASASLIATWFDRLVFAGLGSLLVCVSFLAARGYRAASNVQGLAAVGLLAGFVSLLVASVAVWGLASVLPGFGYDTKPLMDHVGHGLDALAAVLATTAVGAPLVGMALGAIGR